MKLNSLYKKVLAIALSVFIFISANTISVSAVTEICSHGRNTYNDQQLTGGVGQYGNFRRYYWRSGNVDAYWAYYLDTAFSRWVNTSAVPGITTSISFRSTSVKSDASIEVHQDGLDAGKSGITEWYYYSTIIDDPSSRSWGWAIVKYDSYQTRSYSESKKIGLLCHEIGHAMGLSHQPLMSTASIMYPGDDLRSRDNPGSIDCDNINHIYG